MMNADVYWHFVQCISKANISMIYISCIIYGCHVLWGIRKYLPVGGVHFRRPCVDAYCCLDETTHFTTQFEAKKVETDSSLEDAFTSL